MRLEPPLVGLKMREIVPGNPCSINLQILQSEGSGVLTPLYDDPHETITTFLKNLHGVGRYRKSSTEVRVSSQHAVDVTRVLCSFVFIDSM